MFASALVASHFTTNSPYVYPHYVLLILAHPTLLRWVGHRLPPWQIVYISFALFAHPIGGLYGYYASVWWYDHLTHALSATLVAALGYVLIRTVRYRTGTPAWVVPVFTILFIWTAGLTWEYVETQVDWLTVYSYNDTILDHVFNTLGGLLVVTTGPWILRKAPREIAAYVETLPAASELVPGDIAGIKEE